MKYFKLVFSFTIISTMLVFNSCEETVYNTPEEKVIYFQFQKLQKSLALLDGELFFELIDNDTKTYFHNIFLATTDDSNQTLDSLLKTSPAPLLDQLYVFSSRKVFSEEELAQMSPAAYTKRLVQHGVFRDLLNAKITRIDNATQGIAVATILTKVNAKYNLEGRLVFVEDEEQWKIDLTSRLQTANNLIKRFCKNENFSSNTKDCLKAYAKFYSKIELDL